MLLSKSVIAAFVDPCVCFLPTSTVSVKLGNMQIPLVINIGNLIVLFIISPPYFGTNK
jgi:hypothetical protein